MSKMNLRKASPKSSLIAHRLGDRQTPDGFSYGGAGDGLDDRRDYHPDDPDPSVLGTARPPTVWPAGNGEKPHVKNGHIVSVQRVATLIRRSVTTDRVGRRSSPRRRNSAPVARGSTLDRRMANAGACRKCHAPSDGLTATHLTALRPGDGLPVFNFPVSAIAHLRRVLYIPRS